MSVHKYAQASARWFGRAAHAQRECAASLPSSSPASSCSKTANAELADERRHPDQNDAKLCEEASLPKKKDTVEGDLLSEGCNKPL